MKQPTQPLQFWFLSTLVGIMIWVTSPSIKAYVKQTVQPTQSSAEAFPFREYEAQYSIKFHGIKAGESTHRLMQRPDGLYHFASETLPVFDFIPYQFYESTDFSWQENQFFPQNYHYNYHEGKRHKKGNVAFDWQKNTLGNKVSHEPWEMAIPDNIQDKLTQSLRLRYDLIQNQTKLSYNVAEDDEVKVYSFRILGEEEVTTELGTFLAVKVEHVHRKGHRTNTWFAKKLNFMPVKINHIRKGRVVGQGEIINLKWTQVGQAAPASSER